MFKKLLFNFLIIALLAFSLTAISNSFETSSTTRTNCLDIFGKPTYGGASTVHASTFEFTFDPGMWAGAWTGSWEGLFYRDWTEDRDICDFSAEFVNAEYYKNGLAESWERTEPQVVIVYLPKGVLWQDRPPINGRELTAYDVQYTYDRILGTGNGFTEPNPAYGRSIPNVERVVALDKYTLEFRLKNQSVFSIWNVFDGGFMQIGIVSPEIVEEAESSGWEYIGGYRKD